MTIVRRFLPSMALLSAFEAAARHQSFTAAAAELNLTQSAVSRQIRALEEVLGAELFVRERQTVRLTLAGERYAQTVREALQHISAATLTFRANPRGGTLNLAILPTFGTRWLAPRLPGFLAGHPGITVNLTTRLAPFDFRIDAVDAAIHFGAPDWPGAELDDLMGETVVPACSPALRDRLRPAGPEDLLDAPLLHLVSRPDAWERWFEAAGVPAKGVRGMLIDQFATAAQAATAGLGVALLPRFLFEAELARGDLVEAVAAPVESPGRYYLAWPGRREGYPPLQAFRDWIRAEVAGRGERTASATGVDAAC
ncbi:LysR family transcriptional regulator [Azospirillum halopraeferens]|uniref:LysR family transcriptional regulator n=1 Tax=Azospirillum halopraeferens TaxID=34010 RepID=UPI000416D670|nr:LysR family transcriptional regulator [Azospirillum halopraeferens]